MSLSELPRCGPARRINRFTSFHLPLLAILVLLSPFGTAQEINPLTGDGRAAYAGGALFRAQCATCHGADATGISSIDAPDLTSMWRERGYSDFEVFQIIKNGLPGTIMPPHDFNDTELWMLVTFLRSVGESGVTELPAGDSQNGRRLFAAQCAECHRVASLGPAGGVLGPDLSALLARNSLAVIVDSVRNPSALIAPGFKTVRITDASGQGIEGVLKNEDAFSVQIIDRNQRLQSFSKEAVVVSRPATSLMPVFTSAVLSDQDIIDILNFIQTSGGGAQ